MVHKIISKTPTNQLKEVIGDLILENQSAFLRGRLINDNILLAHELFHHMETHKTKSSFMALQLDMSKAFNRVEWSYIIAIMRKMGFNS